MKDRGEPCGLGEPTLAPSTSSSGGVIVHASLSVILQAAGWLFTCEE
jgi:hypothetical protein